MKIYNLKFDIKNHVGLIKREHISCNYKGEFVGTARSWSNVSMEDVNGKPISFKKPTQAEIKGCTIYRFPKLSLPRNKMDLLKESAGIKITRNKDTADYKVVSNSLLSGLLDSSWHKFISGKDLFEAFEQVQVCFTSDAWITLKAHYQKLKQQHRDEILFHVDLNKNWSTANVSFDKVKQAKDNIDTSGDYHIYVSDENEDAYKDIISSGNLVLDTHMNSLCSADLHVLTEEEANNMMSILSTDDIDNLTLALEMMSNCNLEKSLDYVTFVYYFNFERLKMADNWNSVNVKSMRKALKNYDAYSGNANAYYYERYIKQLAEDNYLTEWAFKATAKRMLEGGLFSYGINRDFFQIDLDDIKIKEKYRSKLIKNESGAEILAEITTDPLDDLPF